jgi:hypothetical protein
MHVIEALTGIPVIAADLLVDRQIRIKSRRTVAAW